MERRLVRQAGGAKRVDEICQFGLVFVGIFCRIIGDPELGINGNDLLRGATRTFIIAGKDMVAA